MSSSETLSESGDERRRGVAGRAKSLAKPVAPELARQAESGNLAVASGVVSLVRAARTFLKGKRKRGAAQALVGLFWVGVSLAQRRSSGGRGLAKSGGPGRSHSGDELTEVVDTSPDVDEAVESGGRETDHATGEEVVDTSNADVESEAGGTSRAADESPGVGEGVETGGVESENVDQRDVVGSSDVEDAEADDGEETEADNGAATEADAGMETEADAGVETETDRDAETEVGESEEAALTGSEESETSE